MLDVVGRKAVDRAGMLLSVLGLVAMLVGCEPVNDPSAGMSVPEAVALIDQTPRSDIKLPDLAEAFALNGRSTEVQREALERELVGKTVEWDIPVYEVSSSSSSGDRFEVISQPIPIADGDAFPLLRVTVWVRPQNDDDQTLLMSVKTDDTIRIRGIVQEIQVRTVVAVVPGVVVGGDGDPRGSASD